MMQVVLRNQHPTRLVITGTDDQCLSLAPLERRLLDDKDLSPYERSKLESEHIISITPVPQAERLDWIPGFGGGLIFAFFMIVGVILDENSDFDPPPWIWYAGPIAICLVLAIVALGLRVEKKRIYAWIVQAVTLVIILLIGIGLPAIVTNQSGDLPKLFTDKVISIEQLGQFLQFLFIVVVSLFPALLYYTFDRRQLSTLRERFFRDIFRLDPNVKNLHEVGVKYGGQIEETYGPELPSSGGTLARGTRWPILLATLLITLGWILTFPPQIELPASQTTAENQSVETIVNQSAVEGQKSVDLLGLFIPENSVLVFGFLGAYFFAINMILRRYMRRDLKPKAYTHISVRILVVIILAWVLGNLFPADQPWVLSMIFLAGIVPDTFLTFIQETVRRQLTKGKKVYFASLEEKHPLTNLDGIDLYDRARLLEEGVANIESLAHHNFIDLILETRIPVPRLVDWVDQAILYLHLKQANAKTAGDPQLSRSALLFYGIRTTTNLEKVVARAGIDPEGAEGKATEMDHFIALLGGDKVHNEEQGKNAYSQLRIVLDALSDDDWLRNIRHWRASFELENGIVKIEAPSRQDQPTTSAPRILGAREVGESAV